MARIVVGSSNLTQPFLLYPGLGPAMLEQYRRSWRLVGSGQYLAKSSCENLFMGATLFKPCDRIWKSCAPPKCQMFLWLVAQKRWTSNHLARRGLPHPDKCPLCDQEDGTIDHLLVYIMNSTCIDMRVLG
jgi:hypothetical protein